MENRGQRRGPSSARLIITRNCGHSLTVHRYRCKRNKYQQVEIEECGDVVGISVADGVPGTVAVAKCRGYGRGVSRNASAAGPQGGFIAGTTAIEVDGSGGQAVGSPSCPWVVDALPGQRINFTLMDFFQRRRTTDASVSDDEDDDIHGFRSPGELLYNRIV